MDIRKSTSNWPHGDSNKLLFTSLPLHLLGCCWLPLVRKKTFIIYLARTPILFAIQSTEKHLTWSKYRNIITKGNSATIHEQHVFQCPWGVICGTCHSVLFFQKWGRKPASLSDVASTSGSIVNEWMELILDDRLTWVLGTSVGLTFLPVPRCGFLYLLLPVQKHRSLDVLYTNY